LNTGLNQGRTEEEPGGGRAFGNLVTGPSSRLADRLAAGRIQRANRNACCSELQRLGGRKFRVVSERSSRKQCVGPRKQRRLRIQPGKEFSLRRQSSMCPPRHTD